jgi:hypothetical protein
VRGHARGYTVIAILAACLHGGCSQDWPTDPSVSNPDRGSLTVSADIAAGLEQTVTITPYPVGLGENVLIQSELKNTSDNAINVRRRACGVTLGGSLETKRVGSQCDMYSIQSDLFPGEVAPSGSLVQVLSSPGTYQLEVTHSLDPPRSLSVQVDVLSQDDLERDRGR